MTAQQDQRITDAVTREWRRLRAFIRRRVPDERDAEEILQEVFYELVAAERLLKPIDHVGGWLFRVARNRITDLFRRQERGRLAETPAAEGGDAASLEELLPSAADGPEALYARRILLEELDAALDELPDEQREVFVAHELEGRSFKELAAETGLGINTLLSRKRYAVLRLRQRLGRIHDELTRS